MHIFKMLFSDAQQIGDNGNDIVRRFSPFQIRLPLRKDCPLFLTERLTVCGFFKLLFEY